MNNKIKSFTDLDAWQKSHQLVVHLYKLTKAFPKQETYSLTDQMRRAATSITSNIAEGFSRKGSKEKLQFYHMALGSLTELQNQLLIARDVEYLSKVDFKEIADQSVNCSKLINGLIRYIRNT